MQHIKQPIGTAIRYRYLDLLDWFDQLHFPRIAVVLLLLTLASGWALVGRIRSEAPAAAAPTPSLPIIVIQKELAPPAPVVAQPAQQAVMQPAQTVWVVAFAAPDGVALGAIPMPALSALLGRWGDGWVAAPWQSGVVWIRAADLGLNLSNLQPQIAPQPAQPGYSAPQAPAVEQPYQVSNDQPPPPAQPPKRPAIVAPAPAALPAQQEQPTPAPAPQPPSQPSDVERAWVQEQLRWEHPEWQPRPAQP